MKKLIIGIGLLVTLCNCPAQPSFNVQFTNNTGITISELSIYTEDTGLLLYDGPTETPVGGIWTFSLPVRGGINSDFEFDFFDTDGISRGLSPIGSPTLYDMTDGGSYFGELTYNPDTFQGFYQVIVPEPSTNFLVGGLSALLMIGRIQSPSIWFKTLKANLAARKQ